MKIGISGLPGSGKTTMFNALTGLHAEIGLGQKRKENTGVIKVPDPRLIQLADIHHSQRTVFAEVNFVDTVAPLGEDTKGGGLHTQVLRALQGMDALVVVVRAFENPALAKSQADALQEYRTFFEELILSDLGPLETRLTRMQKERRAGSERELDVIERCIAWLEQAKPLLDLQLETVEKQLIAGLGLISTKPVLVVVNQDEDAFGHGLPAELEKQIEKRRHMAVCGRLEMEIASLPAEEQPDFLEAMGIESVARERFVQEAYGLLDLIHFFTSGPEESRAWPLRKGLSARSAAGKIHSDLERGFIRAEVIGWETLVELGGEKQAKKRGKLRLEGKDYIVRDGDVMTFRFNV